MPPAWADVLYPIAFLFIGVALVAISTVAPLPMGYQATLALGGSALTTAALADLVAIAKGNHPARAADLVAADAALQGGMAK